MTNTNRRHLERLRRVVAFASRHQREFEVTSKAHGLFGETVDLLNKLEARSAPARHKSGANAVPSLDRVLIRALFEQMEKISRTARLLETRSAYFDGRFILPDQLKKGTVIPAAREFLSDATPVYQDFLDYEMPENFLSELEECLVAAGGAKITGIKKDNPPAAAALSVGAVIENSREVLGTLEIIMRNKYRDRPAIMAEWMEAVTLGKE